MPSIGDIANDVKAILEDVKANTLGTFNNTSTIVNQLNQLNTEVSQLNNTTKSGFINLNNTTQLGFTNLAQGLGILIQLQIQNNNLAEENNKQNETVICWLHNIANVLCDIKHNTDTEVKIQKEMSTTLSHLDDILELVHAREAMEVANIKILEDRLDICCPIIEPKPEPCFKDCESPRPIDYTPIKPDWTPIIYKGGNG